MAEATFACPKCKSEFLADPAAAHVVADCPGCSSHLEATFFPALFRQTPTGAEAAGLTDAGQASCFYHPQKQAQRVCDGCGRLICALCSVDMDGQHLCPNCLSTGKRKGRLTTLEDSRKVWDSMALNLSILGILFSCFGLITGPIAIYLAIRHWNSPGSLLGVRKGKFVLAIALSLAEIIFSGGFIFAAFYGAMHPTR